MPVTRYSIIPNPIAVPGYIIAPNGGKVLYVDSGGVRDETTADIATSLYPTVQAALAATRASRGDVVVVLPQHTETISGADGWSNMKAGVKVIGVGNGTERPTITLSAAASQVKLNDANVTLSNLIFTHSTTDVTLGFDVLAAGNTIEDCYIQASDASNKMTTVLRVSSGGNDFKFYRNQVIGGATALTDTVLVNAAVARAQFVDNYITASLATTEGLISLATAAATEMLISRNKLVNRVTNSTVALLGMTACTGFVEFNSLGITNATGGATAISTPGNWHLEENYATVLAKTGILVGTASG